MRGGRSGRRPASAIPFWRMIKLRATFSTEAFEATAYVALSAVARHDLVLLPAADAARRHRAAGRRARRAPADRPGVRVLRTCSPARAPPRGGRLRDRVPHPPPPARRQLAQPRAALARLARRLAGAVLRAGRAAVRRLDRLRPGLLRLGRGARAADLPALGPGRRRRRHDLRPRHRLLPVGASPTSPAAPARCTPLRGSRAASPPCRSRWRGCCSSRASASA